MLLTINNFFACTRKKQSFWCAICVPTSTCTQKYNCCTRIELYEACVPNVRVSSSTRYPGLWIRYTVCASMPTTVTINCRLPLQLNFTCTYRGLTYARSTLLETPYTTRRSWVNQNDQHFKDGSRTHGKRNHTTFNKHAVAEYSASVFIPNTACPRYCFSSYIYYFTSVSFAERAALELKAPAVPQNVSRHKQNATYYVGNLPTPLLTTRSSPCPCLQAPHAPIPAYPRLQR